MKKLIVLCSLITVLLLLAANGILQAQNLIPNGDFELGPDSSSFGWCCRTDKNCTFISYTTPGPTFWTILSGSPDRLVDGDPMSNWCDYDKVSAQSGKAYIVFVWHDVGKATLLTPLQKDSAYKLSYYASLQTFSGLSTKPFKIYFKFSNTNTKDSIFFPLISDTAWKFIDTTFIANANATDIEFSSNEYVRSGANLDNVSLVKTKLNSVNEYNLYRNIKIYPNPTTGKIFFSYLPVNTNKIEVCDILGQTVKIYDKKEIINNVIDLSSLHSGTYILGFETTKCKFTKLILLEK